MKNLTHLIRIQEKIWVNPAHIVKIQKDPYKEELHIYLTENRGVIKVGDEYTPKMLASLQAAD